MTPIRSTITTLALAGVLVSLSCKSPHAGSPEAPVSSQVPEDHAELHWPVGSGVSTFVTQSSATSTAAFPCGSGVNARHILHDDSGDNHDYMHSIDVVVRSPTGANDETTEGRGTDIVAVADGRVIAANFAQNECDRPFGAGNYVIVEHPDILVNGRPLLSAYMHLNSSASAEEKAECGINPSPTADFPIEVGSIVSAGDKLGELGNTGNSTGPHLHFQLATECVLEPASAVHCPSLSILDVNPAGFDRIAMTRDPSCAASPAVGGPVAPRLTTDTYLPDGTYVVSESNPQSSQLASR